MFGNAEKTAKVCLRMFDEEVIIGDIIMGQSTSLEGVLSKDTAFLEIVMNDGERQFVAKNKIVSINPKKPLKKPVLTNPINANAADAYKILGVAPDCTFDEAKTAYHALVKTYHPDTLAGQTLPPEVEQYMSNMLRQVINAFEDIRTKKHVAA